MKRALRSWLLDRLEIGPLLARPGADAARAGLVRPRWPSIAAHDAEFLQVAALYAGRPDFDLPRLVEELVASESVPFLPVLRYKPSGLTKRQVWERTWDLQRREDAGEDVGPIPVPPKYTSADFLIVRHLAAAGQARRAQGAVRQLPALRATATPRSSSAGPAGTTCSRRRPWPPTTTG